MKGSWSIKAVLPTVTPELAYEGLELVQADRPGGRKRRGNVRPSRIS